MSEKKILTTPIKDEDLKDIHVGDIIYLTGHMMPLPVDIRGGAILHAGPIIKPLDNDKFQMVSVGPTTSMRMEKFEYEFIRETGVKLVVGKGGMGEGTQKGCKEFKALHCVFPAGCAVLAATEVEEIEDAQWRDLGMPETLWCGYAV